MQQCIQVTFLPSQLRVFYFLNVPWAPRSLWHFMTTVGWCLCVNRHLQSQLHKQHDKPRCNRSTHLASHPILEAHLAIKPWNSHRTYWTHAFMFSTWFVGGCKRKSERGKDTGPKRMILSHTREDFLRSVVFACFCNTFSLQVFLNVLPPQSY